MTRRKLLQAAGYTIASSQLAGCGLVTGPKPICPFDPKYTNPNSLLTIDVHSHVFNATDLQVKQFIIRVAARQGGGFGQLAKFFGGVLQNIGWNAAPDVKKEMEVLATLKPAIMACDSETNLVSLRSLRQKKYGEAVEELQQEASRRLPALGLSSRDLSGSILSLPPEAQGIRQIRDLPSTYDEFYSNQTVARSALSEAGIQQVNLNSALKFVIEMFQYRFVSVYNYLDTYNESSTLKVDLLTPALVDYDWWLAKGAQTPSSLPDQMRLMKEISILSGGRVHALVPFDPYRQVVHDISGDDTFSPIELVEQSIEKYGAVGVKLYPPMGFAPYGNQQLDIWKNKKWLTDIARTPDFPRLLDDSMSRLYDYCKAHEVPVMGHSNRSNGPSDDFEALTGPGYWKRAANKYSDVSFSMGHFGGAGSEAAGGNSDLREFLDLLVSDHNNSTKRLHADASYFSNLLESPTTLARILEEILRYGPAKANVAMDRLMYGSDWKMLALEIDSESYLDGFDKIISELETRPDIGSKLRSKFFGQNAADFMGLRAGQGNRSRLEGFYAKHGVRRPLWMDKVDDQA